jgi:lysophospholipase L1-like esterase
VRIAFYGDSLTEGWPGAGFMPLLAARLPGHTLLNRGRAGDTTSDILARLRRDGVERVDLAVVWIGTNDAFAAAGGDWPTESGRPAEDGDWLAEDGDWLLVGEPPPDWSAVAATVARTYDLVLELVAPTARRLLLLPPVAPDGDLGEPFTTRLEELARIVEAAAGSRPQVCFVDLRSAFADAAGPFTIDGVHLNETGAAVVAEVVATAIHDEARRPPS